MFIATNISLKFARSLSIIFFTAGIHQPLFSNCNNGLIWKNGTKTTCMNFHYEPMTWIDAVKRCKMDWPQSNLVSIPSDSKQQLIVNHINSDKALTKTGQFGFWTSGNDITSEGHYVWSGYDDPVPLNYTDWHAGQPNNIGGNQDCLLLQYFDDHYKWGDVACYEKHPFICESVYDRPTLGSSLIG